MDRAGTSLSMTLLSIAAVGADFGATRVFDDVTFTVARGERWGIIGRNGTGKTTLFKLITGELEPSRGTIARAPGLRVTLLEQHRDFGDATTVWEAAAGRFAELLALERSLAEQADRLAAAGEGASNAMLRRYDRDLERFEREGGYTFAPRVDAVLHGLGFDPVTARSRPIAALSGGERGRLGLARQLVAPADLLLLDEPTNHLDLDTTRWLEQHLRNTDETVLVISHDRVFLESVVDHVLHFEADTATPYAGSYSAFVRQREERRLTQTRAFVQQRKAVLKEEEYIRRNIAGQNSAQAKGRRKRLERLPRLSLPPSDEDAMALQLAPGERGGDQVVIAEDVALAAAGRTLLSGFSARVARGDVVGLVGPNGAGKSTLLRATVGEHPLERGRLDIGGSIIPAYYRQDLAQVPADRTLYDIIGDLRPAWGRGPIQSHLARFGFVGDAVQRTSSTLSGGERARVALAMIMLSRANLLLLDEPTNHLDVESIETLEDAVESYGGTVILVSHDRALLRALTSRVWVLHEGRITDFAGSFAEWEAVSAERAHAAAVAAAEEEELRRVHERQKTRKGADRQRDGKVARKELEAALARWERAVESADAAS
ncbi:MAG TPA: ABC-F family ATP-binding cassette domain-containing protein [Gemmatimonadaceae bacterium]|nr:ABC-F family ATP-binding cassette domain-containing protein [Gemmatimonadaceae bacterium]